MLGLVQVQVQVLLELALLPAGSLQAAAAITGSARWSLAELGVVLVLLSTAAAVASVGVAHDRNGSALLLDVGGAGEGGLVELVVVIICWAHGGHAATALAVVDTPTAPTLVGFRQG